MSKRTTMSTKQQNRLDSMQDMANAGIHAVSEKRDEVLAVNTLAALLLIATELRDINTTLQSIGSIKVGND